MCLSACEVAVVSPRQIYGAAPPPFVIALFRGIVSQLPPTVRQFIEMGLQVCVSCDILSSSSSSFTTEHFDFPLSCFELQRVVLRGGQYAVRAGQPASEMFLVTSGRLRMVDHAGGSQRGGRVA